MENRSVIVITQGRSGSNLLIGYLDQVPGMISFSEIFRSEAPAKVSKLSKRLAIPEGVVDKLHALQRKDVAEFWRKLQRRVADNDMRAAAKIFYGHAQKTDRVWDNFENSTIFHLIRENALASVVSKKLAQRSDTWQAKEYSPEYDAKPITVGRSECNRHLKNLRTNVSWVRERFAGGDYTELKYSDVIDTRRSEAILSKALNIPVVIARQTHCKQRKRPLEEVVANYPDVKDFDRDFVI